MKSEKARQELEDGSWKVEVGYEGEDVDLPYHAVRVDVAQYAVELAEQEAEERMREKAKRAFECVWNATPKQVAEECGIKTDPEWKRLRKEQKHFAKITSV